MRAAHVVSMIPLMIVMLALSCLIFGCAPAIPPEARIITQEVKVEVPVYCKPKLGQRPELLTKEEVKKALAAAPSLDDRLKIISTQLLLYLGWTPVVEAGLKGCEGPPSN